MVAFCSRSMAALLICVHRGIELRSPSPIVFVAVLYFSGITVCNALPECQTFFEQWNNVFAIRVLPPTKKATASRARIQTKALQEAAAHCNVVVSVRSVAWDDIMKVLISPDLRSLKEITSE